MSSLKQDLFEHFKQKVGFFVSKIIENLLFNIYSVLKLTQRENILDKGK